MILAEKDGVKYLFAEYELKSLCKEQYKFIKFVDIALIRRHRVANGQKVEDYITERQKLINVLAEKIKEHKKVKDKLLELIK